MERADEAYEFIGKLALALYPHGITIRLPALQKILHDRGVYDGAGVSMGQVVAAAHRHWEQKDPVIYHAIAQAFTERNDADLFE